MLGPSLIATSANPEEKTATLGTGSSRLPDLDQIEVVSATP